MTEQEALAAARVYFLTEDNVYGCAETTLIVLQQVYGLPNASDASPAMALNGGVAWQGGICGAISGASLAVGRLAGERIEDHKDAKRAARSIMADLISDFVAEHGHVDCRDLTGLDISSPEGHAAFLESKAWHSVCMRQIEFTIGKLAGLRDELVWRETVARLAALD